MKGPNDYIAAKQEIPKTCCPIDPKNETVCNINSEHIYKDGCDAILASAVGAMYKVFGVVFLAFGAVMLAATIFACCLVSSFREGYQYV